MTKIFTQEDEIGKTIRFEVGEYKGNKLPLVYTKVKNTINPVTKQKSVAMSIGVEQHGRLFDILDIPYNEVFDD